MKAILSSLAPVLAAAFGGAIYAGGVITGDGLMFAAGAAAVGGALLWQGARDCAVLQRRAEAPQASGADAGTAP